ncbi:hypothetical protein [Phascolarctobacterium succinatutens]|uniref:hypothetical protein n=1 Tax=Phascolarctobacterium succinatutens TaxID=626940 RepID=UPI0026EC9DBA|nr:hypothetical protein [Phascolarctobacterium succinatutens]
MTYKDLPASIRNQVEELEISIDNKTQCLDTLYALFPDKETVITVLVEKYAEQRQKELATEEALRKAGYNVAELRVAYWNA